MLGSNIEELDDDFKGHAFCFRNLEEDKYQCYDTDDSIDPKHPSKTNSVQHHGKAVGNNDIAKPEGEGAYRYAHTTYTSWKNLRAKDVGNRTKAHDKATEVNHNTYG